MATTSILSQRRQAWEAAQARLQRFLDLDRYRDALGLALDGETLLRLSREEREARRAYEEVASCES